MYIGGGAGRCLGGQACGLWAGVARGGSALSWFENPSGFEDDVVAAGAIVNA